MAGGCTQVHTGPSLLACYLTWQAQCVSPSFWSREMPFNIFLAGAANWAEDSFLANSLRIGLEPQETCKLEPFSRREVREALSHL